MSFDLAVVAAEPGADEPAARQLIARCYDRPHIDGELDGRIVAFYQQLRRDLPQTRHPVTRTHRGRAHHLPPASTTSS